MSTSAARRPSRRGWLLILAASAVALGACSGPPGGAGPSATPVTAPTVSPVPQTPQASASSQPSSPVPDPSPSAAPTTSGGPVDYAAWIAAQGFGGSSGLRQLLNDVNFLQTNAYAATLFDVDDGAKLVDHLARWLDQNPPTACWADYHAAMQTALGKIHDDFVAVHDSVAGGHSVPADVATLLVTEAQAAFAVAAPAGC